MPSERRFHVIAEGKTAYRIRVQPNASEPELFAAEELQKYLRQMTGVEVPVSARSRGSKTIHVGVVSGDDSPLRNAGDDGFIIRTRKEALVLAGASPRGALYAVYAFLEEVLGCAWLKPGDEFVPETNDLSVPALDRLEIPDFTTRMLVHFPCPAPATRNQIDWMAKRRFNESFLATNNDLSAWENGAMCDRVVPDLRRRGLKARMPGHAFTAWLPPARYAGRHPEYYALIGGERRPEASLCLSNSDAAKEVAANIGAFADQHPFVKQITLWHNDHNAGCECARCREWEDRTETSVALDPSGKTSRFVRTVSQTGAEMRFVNRVAEILERTHPEVTVETLAYLSNYAPSRRVVPRKNVCVGFALFDRLLRPELAGEPVFSRGSRLRPMADYLRQWRAQTERLYLYEYFGFFHDFAPLWDVMRADFQSYLRYGICQIGSEIGTRNDLHMYFLSRLSWSSRTSVDNILRDYCRASYGPAAGTMEEFWQVLRRAHLPWNYGLIAARRAGVTPGGWDAGRRSEARWARAERRCMEQLDSAVRKLRGSPLLPRGTTAQSDPRALDRVRQLRSAWAEPVIPWWAT